MSNTRQIENAMSPQQQHQYVHPVSALQVDYGRQVPPTSPASYPQQFPSERQQPSDYQLHPSTGLSPRFLPQQQHPERRKRKRSIEQSPPAEQLVSQIYRTFTATFSDFFILLPLRVAVLSFCLASLGFAPTAIVTMHDLNASAVIAESFSALRDTALYSITYRRRAFLIIISWDIDSFCNDPICCQPCRA